jgi:cardiolipin synthase
VNRDTLISEEHAFPGPAKLSASQPVTLSSASVRLTVAGHDLTIFVESPPLFNAMLRDIHMARQRVWLESYIFLDDAAGQVVGEALKDRARAGLDVRVLYDAVGCLSTPAVFFQHLQEAGVKVHAFHSFWEIFWRFPALRFLNRRNHRKLLIIDDRAAYFGGMNLVDQSQIHSLEDLKDLPASAGWRDVHARLAGPQQSQVAESFERSWRLAHGQPVERRPRHYREARLAPGEESIQFFDSGPGLKHTRAARLFSRLIRTARHSLTFAMAYFLPVGRVLRDLLRAHKRGVFVRVVVPGESDVPIVQRATRYLYSRLLRRRFHIYERQRNMLHSKVLIVDEQWTVLGSANLDARSLWYHLEFLAVIHSRNLARVMNTIIGNEIAHSRRITLRECLQQSWWRRWTDRLAWAVRWWL